MRVCFLFFLLLLSQNLSCRTDAETQIVFVIGEIPVFEQDFRDRTRFTLLMLGNDPKNMEQQKTVRDLVIKNLVDETLQVQAAEKVGLKVSKQEINEAVKNLATNNKMSLQQLQELFKKNQIPFALLRKQVKAQILWSRYIQGKYVRDSSATKGEIEKQVQRIKSQKGKAEYHLAEIAVHAPDGDKGDAFERMRSITSLLQQGAPFPAVARQFSDSASAKNSGYLGWLQEGDLDPRTLAVIKNAQPGSLTEPFETEAGYGLFVVIGKRTNTGATDQDLVANTLRQERFELAAKKELTQLKKQTMIQYR